MKRILYTFGAFAVAALALSACQKQEVTLPENDLVTVTFTAEKAGLDTKTAAVEETNEVTFVWTDEDLSNIKLFSVGEDADGKETLTVVQNPTITKVSDTKLTIAAKVAPNATYTFRSVLSGKWTNKNHPRLSESQTPSVSNFDPTADILISDDMEVTVGAAEEGEETVATSAYEMVFRRPVVVNKMTLKNLKVGEAIDKVVITSSVDIAGYVYSDSKTAVGDKKTITLNYNKAVTVPEGGQFPVYFTTIPGTGHSLTVEVTTDQFVYTKSFAEDRSVDFNLGQFTKFNLALPAGVANTALTLPFSDDFSWASTGASLPSDKYSESSTLYFDKGKLRLGTSSVTGFITTKEIDLSSAFYVKVNAFAYNAGSDKAKIQVKVDDGEAQTAVNDNTNLGENAKDYYFNFAAATKKSKVTITVAGTNPRFVLNSLDIVSGTYVLPPVINVTSDNPMSVANTAGTATIEYEIANSTEATLTAALQDATVTWISNIDYDADGEVTFDVAAQEAGAAARSAIIVLSYSGAENVEVKVEQAPGDGGSQDYTTVWTASSGALGSSTGSGTIYTTVSGGTNTQSWSYTRSLISGDSYTGFSSSCIQLGKNGGVENLTLSTSNIPGTIKSVSVECSSYNNAHNVSISVGGVEYLSKTATAKWTTVSAATGTGTSSGEIVISFTDGTRALYIKSITVVYNN